MNISAQITSSARYTAVLDPQVVTSRKMAARLKITLNMPSIPLLEWYRENFHKSLAVSFTVNATGSVCTIGSCSIVSCSIGSRSIASRSIGSRSIGSCSIRTSYNFIVSAIRFFATSTLITLTSTISPTLTASSGCLINFSDICEMWTSPS